MITGCIQTADYIQMQPGEYVTQHKTQMKNCENAKGGN